MWLKNRKGQMEWREPLDDVGRRLRAGTIWGAIGFWITLVGVLIWRRLSAGG